MPLITCLVGLCGSGKTPLAKQIETETGARRFEMVLPGDAAGAVRWEALRRTVLLGQDCIVEEAYFCVPANREWFEGQLKNMPNVTLRWIYFEKDLESANWNVLHGAKFRGKPDVQGHFVINEQLFAHYLIPEGAAIPLPIKRCPEDPSASI